MKISEKNIRKALLKNKIINHDADILKAEEVNSGNTNHAYIITTKTKKYFCKYAQLTTKVNYIAWETKNRLANEAKAIQLVKKLTNNKIKIPNVIFHDKEHSVLCLDILPEWSSPLSDLLLSGEIGASMGKKLGENLACIHQSSVGIAKHTFPSKECLKKIRIPLTYKNISPSKEIQKKIDELWRELLNNEICLVHTDYKPNNIFIDKDGCIIVIDFEFMHIGDPAAECGFFIGIYIHYAFSEKNRIEPYVHTIENFWKTYKKNLSMAKSENFESRVIQHAWVQLLARLDGNIKFPTSQNKYVRNIFRPLSEAMIFWKIKHVAELRGYLLQFSK